MTAPSECFHCGEPLAGRAVQWVRLGDAEVALCCPGCRAALQLIAGLGLEDFYRFRTAPSVRPTEIGEWLAYDEPAVIASLCRQEPDGRAVILLIDGLTCAACSWLIGRALQRIDGVVRTSVNTASGRAQVVWNPDRVALSRVLRAIAELGYRPHPVTPESSHLQVRDERRAILKRLAVAGLGMMQVMMFAVAMYSGDFNGMDEAIRAYLRIVSLLVATPVMLYAGWPFLKGAAQALRSRIITMDVPVSVGLLLAYGASVINTWRHAGQVYFDSVTMFIFFLSIARYVEMIARHQSVGVTDSLSRLLPVTAHRLAPAEAGAIQDVTVGQLAVADRLLVRTGEVVPADGEITLGATRVDESMLTGESTPVSRAVGDRVAAGTINLDAPLRMRITAVGPATLLASIVALLNRAQAERPRVTRAADLTASRFLARVLIGAALVCVFWLAVDPDRAFAATLAVLVVACPCALSLATLVAVASANAALARRGVLVTHADAVEGLARATCVVFDKTGTLTQGTVTIGRCMPRAELPAHECLAIAASLEAASEHPIARAFSGAVARSVASDVRIVAGAGIEGVVEGARYRIGTRAFAAAGGAEAGTAAEDIAAKADDDAAIVLGKAGVELAAFTLGDASRAESARTVALLEEQGLEVQILSGDSAEAVGRLARQCGISRYRARQSPMDKLEHIRALAARGEFVAMVGDGINDAPVLGGSGVSIAMGRGSALALASADLILMGDSLDALPGAFLLARRAQRIIKQNLVWAAGYNLTAMPLAAMGWVPPWLAAIGMSLSSILVVLNSMRVMRRPAPTAAPAATEPAAALVGRSSS